MNTSGNIRIVMLAAGWLISAGCAVAQTLPDKNAAKPGAAKEGAEMRSPVDPGMSKAPPVLPQDSAGASGSGSGGTNSGVIVTPPSTGTEERVTKKPQNVDPEITGPTSEIDRKNREKSEEKAERGTRGKAY